MKKKKYKNSGYSAGGASREKNVLKTWQPAHYSSKSDLEINLPLLRNRAFDLAVNSALGCSAIQTETTGVLGAGLKLYPKPNFKELGLSAEAAREWSRHVKLEFELWANNLNCDYQQRNNFFELQRIVFQSYLTDGDAFCLFRRRIPNKDNPYSLRLQILEAQRVSNPQTNNGAFGLSISPVEMTNLQNGNRIINGVEVDKNGRLMAVWVCNKIWNEPLNIEPDLKWRRVRVFGKETGTRNVLHICIDNRPDMYRGAPFLAPVIEVLKQVARYSDAELTSAVIKSFFSIFFIQPQSNFELNDVLPEENKLPVDVREYKLGSGTISCLPRGVDVKAIDRNDAQSTFDPFMNHFIRQIASALNLPEEILTKRFQSSYSAARASLLLAQDEFRIRKASFVQDFCQPIYENFLIEAVALGRIQAEGFFDDPLKRKCWANCEWRNEQTHAIDELKEINAAQLRINLGLSTREIESARQGTDFFENVEQLAIENALMKTLMPEETIKGGEDDN